MLQLRYESVKNLTTAADVIANAREVQRQRKAMKAPPLPVSPPPKLAALELPPPPTISVTPPTCPPPPVLAPTEPEEPPVRRIYAFRVRDHVAKFYGLTVAELTGQSRRQIYARPRHLAYYLMTRLAGASTPRTGDILGRRDHSTIIYGVQKIEKLMAAGDTAVLSDIAELTKIIEGAT